MHPIVIPHSEQEKQTWQNTEYVGHSHESLKKRHMRNSWNKLNCFAWKSIRGKSQLSPNTLRATVYERIDLCCLVPGVHVGPRGGCQRQAPFSQYRPFTTASTTAVGDMALAPSPPILLLLLVTAGPLTVRLKIIFFTLHCYGHGIGSRLMGHIWKQCVPPLAHALRREGVGCLSLSLPFLHPGMWS